MSWLQSKCCNFLLNLLAFKDLYQKCLKLKRVNALSSPAVSLNSYSTTLMCSVLFTMTSNLDTSIIKKYTLKKKAFFGILGPFKFCRMTKTQVCKVSWCSSELPLTTMKWKTRIVLPFWCCSEADLIHKPKQECTDN